MCRICWSADKNTDVSLGSVDAQKSSGKTAVRSELYWKILTKYMCFFFLLCRLQIAVDTRPRVPLAKRVAMTVS